MTKDKIIDQFFIKFIDNDFLHVAEYLLKETGYADEFSGCYFPDEFDEFDGVMFRYMDDEITISKSEFRVIICQELKRFAKQRPDKCKKTFSLINTYDLKD